MGLDQYLKAERYLSPASHYGDDVNEAFHAVRKVLDIELDTDYPSITVRCNVGYWRKANAIHQWFVDNVQDGVDECQEAYVSREKLAELMNVCEQVLGDHSLADDLLPTASGFFFGNTAYDEWYFESLEYSISIIKNALSLDEEYQFSYQSSW
jgi:hypothetical protein